uniref:Uncharacterized protein n=1 Tax=Lepeophtheirus salmonis TaxID=72036 RepID=A0A0K2URN3_LEPSM
MSLETPFSIIRRAETTCLQVLCGPIPAAHSQYLLTTSPDFSMTNFTL